MKINALPVADVTEINFTRITALINANFVLSSISVEPVRGFPVAISFGASIPLHKILTMVERMGLGALNIYSGSQLIATTEY